jgi:hypothetical protein
MMNPISFSPVRKILLHLQLLSFLQIPFWVSAQGTLSTNHTQSPSYDECIAFYRALEKTNKIVRVLEAGPSDTDRPIYVVVIDKDGLRTADRIRQKGRAILMINNGIHPGEPEGIEASMMLAEHLAKDRQDQRLLDSVSMVIIPVYNVGGALFRNSHTRANQNGPSVYGFRGNRNYLDLNRDFIKCDSRNAETFTRLYQTWDPDVFIDTHTSNGADYSYNNTLLPSQKDKLDPGIKSLLYGSMIPYLFREMEKQGDPLTHYVHPLEKTPEQGIAGFMDSPRYSSGYAALHHAMPFLIETHMIKDYGTRLASTYRLLDIALLYMANHAHEIRHRRKLAFLDDQKKDSFCISWKQDLSICDSMDFRGYESEIVHYPVLDLDMHHYDTNRPYLRKIPLFDHFREEIRVARPEFYLIPQAYEDVIERLAWNGIEMQRLEKDTLVEAEFYEISDLNTPARAYENHHLHSQVRLSPRRMSYPYLKGDYLISTRQRKVRFLMEVLEPQATDSYFAWNFFDAILQRKEYFSDYLFAPVAEELLKKDPQLRQEFQERLKKDPDFATSPSKKLAFVYERSAWSEPFYRIYPVARIRPEWSK